MKIELLECYVLRWSVPIAADIWAIYSKVKDTEARRTNVIVSTALASNLIAMLMLPSRNEEYVGETAYKILLRFFGSKSIVCRRLLHNYI